MCLARFNMQEHALSKRGRRASLPQVQGHVVARELASQGNSYEGVVRQVRRHAIAREPSLGIGMHGSSGTCQAEAKELTPGPETHDDMGARPVGGW
jgi:hypothetical protein